ncbi:zona pellucida sperm-binding protein 3-like [Chanos chanos]|uniref:Zona pellucida sperm-binding protein 3 n=1 Tax=Chanos chanos TaxID=29144 RepID=A0A6J2WGL8_CHACN|nr:zona pellucida sperm-binding protein 3-like [Chanos chanos]
MRRSVESVPWGNLGEFPWGNRPQWGSGRNRPQPFLVDDEVGKPAQEPVKVEPEKPQEPVNFQSKQMLQGPVKTLSWSFPKTPEKPKQPAVPFELQMPVPAHSVAVQCGENRVFVEVKQDMFGIGQPIQPAALTLGGCTASEVDQTAQVVLFQSELQECGSTLTMTEDELVYSFTLTYKSEALAGTPIVRTGGAVVGIECHYFRKNNVSSNTLRPTWIPYASTKVAEDLLVFSLRLMTDDWKFERPSNQYFLGDLLNIEASVIQYNHVPLQVFVDRCVATVVPDISTDPSYSFIENHGCFVDPKITGSSSRFLPRTQVDKLQFQLEAFRFHQDGADTIYITCFLKATAASSPFDAEHKACSFLVDGWSAAGGNDQVCGCCDSSCGFRKGRDVDTNTGPFMTKISSMWVLEEKGGHSPSLLFQIKQEQLLSKCQHTEMAYICSSSFRHGYISSQWLYTP